MATIGELHEVQGEAEFEWRIDDFFSLSKEQNAHYDSIKFYFSGASWEIRLYPNDDLRIDKTKEAIGVYLIRMSAGSPIKLDFSLGFKTVKGNEDPKRNFTFKFEERKSSCGSSELLLRSVIEERKAELAPSDVVTVLCTLKKTESVPIAGSLFNRLQDVSDNLKKIYRKANKADFTLKVNDKKIRAHRVILETRSPVFAAMFSHDTRENQTGEIRIEDIEIDAIDPLLVHMYSGDIEGLNTENVLSIYAAAEKYDIKGTKEICLSFIEDHLSVECVCDVIKFADVYGEKDLRHSAKKYFNENADKIMETENWKTFVRENRDIGIELLGCVVKSLLSK